MQVPFCFDDVKRLRRRTQYGSWVKTNEYNAKLKEWHVWLEKQRELDARQHPYPKFKKMVVRTWKEIYK